MRSEAKAKKNAYDERTTGRRTLGAVVERIDRAGLLDCVTKLRSAQPALDFDRVRAGFDRKDAFSRREEDGRQDSGMVDGEVDLAAQGTVAVRDLAGSNSVSGRKHRRDDVFCGDLANAADKAGVLKSRSITCFSDAVGDAGRKAVAK